MLPLLVLVQSAAPDARAFDQPYPILARTLVSREAFWVRVWSIIGCLLGMNLCLLVCYCWRRVITCASQLRDSRNHAASAMDMDLDSTDPGMKES
jgi:hypothetical protein